MVTRTMVRRPLGAYLPERSLLPRPKRIIVDTCVGIAAGFLDLAALDCLPGVARRLLTRIALENEVVPHLG